MKRQIDYDKKRREQADKFMLKVKRIFEAKIARAYQLGYRAGVRDTKSTMKKRRPDLVTKAIRDVIRKGVDI